MASYASHIGKKTKQQTIEEFLAKALSSTNNNLPNSGKITPITLHGSKIQGSPCRTPNTLLCKGISLSTGLPCKRPVVTENYCFQHRTQINGRSPFGIPFPTRKNQLPDNDVRSDSENVTDLSTLKVREKRFGEISTKLSTLSLSSQKENIDKVQKRLNGELTKDSSTTVVMISLDNNVKVHITQSKSPNKLNADTNVSISSEEGKELNKIPRPTTPPPIRQPIDPSPAIPDDNFIETINKEFFQTPSVISPNNELPTAPWLSSSPTLSTRTELPPVIKRPVTPTKQLYIDLTKDFTASKKDLSRKNRKAEKGSGRKTKKDKEEIIVQTDECERILFVPGRSKLVWVKFDDWINHSLSEETKRQLKLEMEKPISDKDEAGFIYAYRLVEGLSTQHDPNFTLYKVGRATNVHRRLYQWSHHCGFMPELIELFPNVKQMSSFNSQESFLESLLYEENEGNNSSFSDERLEQLARIPKCKYTHRAERLIHIELSEKFKVDMGKCSGCGNIHREWFQVKSGNEGWEEVRKVIVHWMTYVEKHYGVG
ncbi:16355_t:CDS:2 [Dentiscutata erythropus]|uniref:16355_t:CDS:1 n=1 Tax=Dentiscutata erythropus TaxID=1348616 RepID=A0A9N9I4B6_9GLOM|nr:16355_t:CDS:2 [Dentiscutata erythropus]